MRLFGKLSGNDHSFAPAPDVMRGFEDGTVRSIRSDESIVVVYGRTQTVAVLKTFNSFVRVGDKRIRPLGESDISQIEPGCAVKIKVEGDGQLKGLVEPNTRRFATSLKEAF